MPFLPHSFLIICLTTLAIRTLLFRSANPLIIVDKKSFSFLPDIPSYISHSGRYLRPSLTSIKTLIEFSGRFTCIPSCLYFLYSFLSSYKPFCRSPRARFSVVCPFAMSNPTSQSRLSVDLGVGKKIVTSRSVRQNPPRLQHSPSLPNIWQVNFLLCTGVY